MKNYQIPQTNSPNILLSKHKKGEEMGLLDY